MGTPPDLQQKLCDRIQAHHEHSDEMYLKYFNSLISISFGIFAIIGFLISKYFEKDAKIYLLYLIYPALFSGIYTCYLYNTYLQNEKEYQNYLINIYDEIDLSEGTSLHLLPTPFTTEKRKWKGRGWSKLPRDLIFTYSIAFIGLTGYLLLTTCTCQR